MQILDIEVVTAASELCSVPDFHRGVVSILRLSLTVSVSW